MECCVSQISLKPRFVSDPKPVFVSDPKPVFDSGGGGIVAHNWQLVSDNRFWVPVLSDTKPVFRERPCFGFYGRPETGFVNGPKSVFVRAQRTGFYEWPKTKTGFRESRSLSGPAAISYIELANAMPFCVWPGRTPPPPPNERGTANVDVGTTGHAVRPSPGCSVLWLTTASSPVHAGR
jgi:hypothetical protein